MFKSNAWCPTDDVSKGRIARLQRPPEEGPESAPKPPCLDGAPSPRVALKVLSTSRERSCLRPFDADGIAPLALMIRPPGSSPPSFPRARSGADRSSGFQAFALGSHHFVGALDFPPRLAARIPLAEPVAVVRPQLAGRRIGRPSSSARRRCAPPCWRARPRVSLNLYLTVLRSSIPLAHRRRASLWPLRWWSVAQAPTTSSLRR